MLIRTDADTGYMHEGFHPDDPSDFHVSGSPGLTAFCYADWQSDGQGVI